MIYMVRKSMRFMTDSSLFMRKVDREKPMG
jgi:hypothetical protein